VNGPGATPGASVVFTAHNRRDMVLRAIALARAQTVPLEIIVADDASTDGTRDAVMAADPQVTYLYSPTSMGACYQRNRGVKAAHCEIVFLLDDDSMLVSEQTVAQALKAFAALPEAAIIALPFINTLQDEVVRHTPAGRQLYDFVACAHAVRRNRFLEVGGYCELLFYMVEEADLALRLRDRGGAIVSVDCDPLHHLQPPARRSYKADFFGRRNYVLLYYMRAPWPYVVPRVTGAVVKGILFGVRTRRVRAAIHGALAAFRLMAGGQAQRAPVRRQTFADFLAARQDG